MKRLHTLALLLAALMTGGCASDYSRYRINSNWIRKNPEGSSFVIVQPISSPVRHFDFDEKFTAYSAYLKAALEDKGYLEAYSVDDADLAIEFYYTSGAHSTTTPMRFPGVPTLEHSQKYIALGIAAFDMERYTPAARWDPNWWVHIQAPGQWEEMDQQVPVMIAAIMPYIGQEVNRWVNVFLEENEAGEQVVRIVTE